MTSVRAPDGRTDAPINVFGNARAFAGPEDRTVVAPNVDTLYRVVALSRLGRPPRRRAPGDPGRVVRSPTPGGLAFLDALGDALAGNPPPARDRAVLRRLAAAGIGPGHHPSKAGLPAAVLAGLVEGLGRARAQLPVQARTQILRAALASGGWYVSPPGIGAYGTHYLLRARIAIVGLGANTPQEAVYPVAFTDSAGRLLNGSQRYRITFAKGRAPPVRAFWSLTVYDADGFLVANPARRYAVGDSHPPLARRPDGSIVIAVQRGRPAQRDVNWLPAPPGGFRLSLRLYRPVRSILRCAWTPPPVQRLPAKAP